MQTLLQIRVDESIQQESYGVSLPLLTTYCLLPNKDSGVCYQTSNTGGNNFTIKQLKMQQQTILRDCVKKTFYFGTNFV